MQVEMKYQLFNLRILFFVFLTCFWLFIYNYVLFSEKTAGTTMLFLGGLIFIDEYIFKRTGRIFFRKGSVVLERKELKFVLNGREKIIQRNSIQKIEKNKYKTMGVVFLAITVFYDNKKFKLYFEDVNEKNAAFYDELTFKMDYLSESVGKNIDNIQYPI